MAKTPCFQCRGPRFDAWWGNWIPHATTSSHATTKRICTPQLNKKDLACHKEDQRSCRPQLTLGTVNETNKCGGLVTQSCLTLCNPMSCSPAGSSVLGDSLCKNTGVGCHVLLQRIFLTQGSNQGLPHCKWIIYCPSHHASPNT